MAPKREKNKEKLRELKRQGDPNFPGASSSLSQQASRIPRPSILVPGRQNAPPQQETPHVVPIVVNKKPEETKAAAKAGLRVTFDLSRNGEDKDPETMPEQVADCWEDLSDDDDGHISDAEYEINEEDVIDCEREFGDIGEEFMELGHGSSTLGTGGGIKGRGGSKVDFFIGPRHIPGLNDIEDFNAIDDDDSDYDNVETSRNRINNSEQNVRYFSDDNSDDKVSQLHDVTPVVPEIVDVAAVNYAIKEVELPKHTENKIPVVDSSATGQSENNQINNDAKLPGDKTGFSGNNKIPFIDGAEEVTKEWIAAVDDEWETEPSGGSDESGKVYKIDNNYTPREIESSVQQMNKMQTIHHLTAVAFDDDGTLADQASLGEEDDSDIITNEDFDAAFHSVMKEDDESVPEFTIEGGLDERHEPKETLEGNPLTLFVESSVIEKAPELIEIGLSEERPEQIQEGVAEYKPDLTQGVVAEKRPELIQVGLSDEKPELIQVSLSDENPELIHVGLSENSELSQPTYTELAEGDDVRLEISHLSKEEIEIQEEKESLPISPGTHDELASPHEPNVIPESLGKPKVSEKLLEPQESLIGPLEKTVSQSKAESGPTSEDRAESPKVSIGFECREGKSKSIFGSETESEGELVIGEDKCVGTTDDYAMSDDDEPLDLSSSDKTSSSKGENDMSESRDSLSFRSEDESQSERGSLALDIDEHKVSANSGTVHLDVPAGNRVDTSPSPEIPVDAPIGKSESIKEKEKINEKKSGKKKGKKNKREGKLDQAAKAEMHPDRPRLVRGRTWKEKREKFKTEHGDVIPLSFGKELCESEIVEGTSNLLTETYTEASLLTASRCSTETTVVTETPCTACSSLTGEFSESESLCKDCLRGEKKRPADAIAKVTEIKACDEKLCHTPTITQSVNISTISGSEKGAPDNPSIHVTGEKDDFYIVKACEVAVPLEVLTEYVADSESSEETNGLHMADKHNKIEPVNDSKMKLSTGSKEILGNNIGDNLDKEDEPELYVDSSSSFSSSSANSSDEQNPVYFDAKDSSCTDRLTEPYDYVDSFPSVIGTQNLNFIYSYDGDAEFERRTDRPKLTVKPLKATLRSSGVMVVNLGEDNEDDLDTPPPTSGDIVYEGPCMCGPGEGTRNQRKGILIEGFSSEEDMLCVPPLFGNNRESYLIDDGKTMGLEKHDFETFENMGSNPEDSLGNCEEDAKDIRSRIKEIVGPRLHQKRGRHTVRRRGGSGVVVTSEGQEQNQDPEGGGRDESPMPGSSPASSSGVQGSDEMSPSRSRSRSPSLEESVSATSTTDNVPDLAYEAYQVHEISPTKVDRDSTENVRVLKNEGNVESIPEKGNQVDYSFQTFRDMYQINPVYMTDSGDDHDDLNESDTVIQGSPSLSYDPDRSITVSSWGSTSEESPAPQDPSTSPPLPPGVRATKKVPKVTRQLRETQGIVQRWEVLQAQAVERQRQSGQVRELQRQVKNMRLTLENLADQANEAPQTDPLETHQQLDHKLQEAKAVLEEVRARKSEVSSLNLAVHRFFTDSGYSLAQLKDEVNDLYILYDEAHRRATNEVSRLEGLEATWKLWETEAEELNRALRQDGDTLKVLDVAMQTGSLTDSVTASVQDVARLLNDKRRSQQPGKKLMLQHTRTQGVDIQGSTLSLGTSGDDCLSDSGTSGYESCSSEELSERERRLAHLRRLARDLEASLSPDSQAWAAITKTLSSAEMELKGLQKHCRELVVRSTETLDQTKTSPQLRRRSWMKDSKVGRMSRGDRRMNGRDSNRGNGRRGWMWRVVRAALPFQAALLLLFCVACLLEPNCCDTHNSLTMTLTPQLRYVHGPPPV